MGRIAPRRRKNNRVYQPLLHSWLTIRQKVLPDAKNTDEQNLISEINAPEQRVDPDNVTEPALAPTQRKGVQSIKELWLKIWHLPDSFQWMEPLPFFHRRGVIIATTVLLLALLWPASRDNTDLSFPLAPHRPACHYRPNYKTTMTYPSPPKFPLLRRHKETGRAIRSKRVKRWRNCSAIITCQSTMFLPWLRSKAAINR